MSLPYIELKPSRYTITTSGTSSYTSSCEDATNVYAWVKYSYNTQYIFTINKSTGSYTRTTASFTSNISQSNYIGQDVCQAGNYVFCIAPFSTLTKSIQLVRMDKTSKAISRFTYTLPTTDKFGTPLTMFSILYPSSICVGPNGVVSICLRDKTGYFFDTAHVLLIVSKDNGSTWTTIYLNRSHGLFQYIDNDYIYQPISDTITNYGVSGKVTYASESMFIAKIRISDISVEFIPIGPYWPGIRTSYVYPEVPVNIVNLNEKLYLWGSRKPPDLKLVVSEDPNEAAANVSNGIRGLIPFNVTTTSTMRTYGEDGVGYYSQGYYDSFTLTEKVAGGGNTPPEITSTGSIQVERLDVIESSPGICGSASYKFIGPVKAGDTVTAFGMTFTCDTEIFLIEHNISDNSIVVIPTEVLSVTDLIVFDDNTIVFNGDPGWSLTSVSIYKLNIIEKTCSKLSFWIGPYIPTPLRVFNSTIFFRSNHLLCNGVALTNINGKPLATIYNTTNTKPLNSSGNKLIVANSSGYFYYYNMPISIPVYSKDCRIAVN